ncbi:hypothetical protein K474DRAFT_1662980 [Panus rudis PR-1116 ss-1]|nr:hypothetical protein K474DRAFT_1662968 [Panus rudis PR-1116 ss-1]KAI0076452.1 hypothetical protein K474DRAFT_1662980 [Panus rudis PR-1116 ss-1]
MSITIRLLSPLSSSWTLLYALLSALLLYLLCLPIFRLDCILVLPNASCLDLL